MVGKNWQAYLRSISTNGRNIPNTHTHRSFFFTKAESEPAPNTTGSNEAGTNVDTYCLGQNVISISYTNQIVDLYPYSQAYEPIENVLIVSRYTAYYHTNGNIYIPIFP